MTNDQNCNGAHDIGPRAGASAERILITGGAGFIGSHLAEALLAKGHQVTVIDKLSTGRFENIAHLVKHPNFRFAIDSVTNEVVMDRLVSECDLIYHLAAAVGVKWIMEHPVSTLETNFMGTEMVMKIALRYRVKVLVTSTSEVYGKGNAIPFRENDDVVLGATSRRRWAYAASKMVNEFLVLSYYREKGLPVVIARLFNTVGPRQTDQYGMVLPRFVEQALRGEPLTIYGDGRQSRCFLHVLDAVDGLIRLANCPEAVGEVANVGSTEEISIVDLARKVIDKIREHSGGELPPLAEGAAYELSQDGRLMFIPMDKVYDGGFEDMDRRYPDTGKINGLTGWAPQRSLDCILDETVLSIKNSK